jgi:hypothetical protein
MEFKLTKLNEKWFFLAVLPLAIAIEWAFAQSLDWTAYPRAEWVALVDLCVIVPIIYFAFFSRSLGMKARLIRTAGIAGLGLLASSYIVPGANQIIIGELSSIRNAVLLVVVAFEIFVFWKMISALYINNADEKALERDFAVPEFVAKLLVMEAKFWKAVWRFFRRK